mmetsp:Transcript_19105/g.43494  ORF Transcript_19105/g.43494 Transcript_19105/m.43494 type:complete len:342 (-) Transcript_19105:203-1228(-)
MMSGSELKLLQGRCPKCGSQTHRIIQDIFGKDQRKLPLTIDGIAFNGRCLLCFPIEERTIYDISGDFAKSKYITNLEKWEIGQNWERKIENKTENFPKSYRRQSSSNKDYSGNVSRRNSEGSQILNTRKSYKPVGSRATPFRDSNSPPKNRSTLYPLSPTYLNRSSSVLVQRIEALNRDKGKHRHAFSNANISFQPNSRHHYPTSRKVYTESPSSSCRKDNGFQVKPRCREKNQQALPNSNISSVQPSSRSHSPFPRKNHTKSPCSPFRKDNDFQVKPKSQNSIPKHYSVHSKSSPPISPIKSNNSKVRTNIGCEDLWINSSLCDLARSPASAIKVHKLWF